MLVPNSWWLCVLGWALSPGLHAFQPGIQYTYMYESRVALDELPESNQPAELLIRANLTLSRLRFSRGLSAVRLQFLAAVASNGRSSAEQNLRPPESEFLLPALEPKSPAWFGSVIVPESEDPFWLNLARGVASLFRHRDPDVVPPGTRVADTMGECGLTFAWLGGPQQRRLEKRTEDCENVELAGERSSAGRLLSVRRTGNAKTVFEFPAGGQPAPPDSLLATEVRELLPDLAAGGFGIRAKAESRARLLSADATARAEGEFETLSAYLQLAGRPTREVAMPTALEFERPDSTGSLTQFLTRLPSYLRDANPSMHALAIVQGLPLARGAKDQTKLRSQLEQESNKPHLADILELYSACGTRYCIGALFEFVTKHMSDLSDALIERLLLALAQVSRVGRPLLERTLDVVRRLEGARRWTAARAAYQTLATLGRKIAAAGGPESDVPDVLLSRLADCEANAVVDAEESVDCQMAVLSAMSNCPSLRYRRPLLRGLLVNATIGTQVTVARLRALQASGPLDAAERRHLAGLLGQRLVPLSDPIRFALASALGGPAACAEAGVDCRSLRRGADLWLPLRRRYRQPGPGHEEVLAGLTSSTLQHGRFFDAGGSGDVEFELTMLGNRLGGTRLSEFRLLFSPSATAIPMELLGVRLYADAIDSLLDSGGGGGGDSAGDLTEEATAGMQLGVLGEWQRPLRFFSGTSGLMSAVWNAPDRPVAVLESVFLLNDFAARLHLHNGLVVQTTLTGALALNVSGSLSVSIWNRNAASKVLNSVGMALYAQAAIRTGRFSLDFVSQAQAELLNSFATFVTFAEAPVRTCLLMSNSPMTVTRNCHATDSVGPRYDHHSHDYYFPGRSFSLGSRNDRLCTELVPDADEE